MFSAIMNMMVVDTNEFEDLRIMRETLADVIDKDKKSVKLFKCN